jgi:hypothetical protein
MRINIRFKGISHAKGNIVNKSGLVVKDNALN